MDRNRTILMALALLGGASAFAQDSRSCSSLNLTATDKSDVTIPFYLSGEGKRFQPTWGVDEAWISEQNLKKGINHMGKENIGIGRTAFRFNKPLINDSVLDSKVIDTLRVRSRILDLVSDTLPVVFTADQEAWGGTDASFVVNRQAKVGPWAAMINSHVAWMKKSTKHPVVGISPFNEPDYWTTEEGATVEKQVQVAQLLRDYYSCKGIAIVGGNTLNNDKAMEWYASGKQYYDWGNTHQLAGSFDSFAAFYQQLQKDGKTGYGDEMHNVGEAMIGLEYGMTVGIWWGFDSRARGEFCQISRHGERLAYAEHRTNWTAASVYRHDDGRVKAFVGSSERQAKTTSYQFVSPEREVYYDCYGPVREFRMEMPGGTGYQTGQTNGERVINVTWGEDVPPSVINGTYRLVNKRSGNVAGFSSLGSQLALQSRSASDKKQQWIVRPCDPRCGGDYSFYDIISASNEKIHINVLNFSTGAADVIAFVQDKPTSNEQWYLEYAGDGYYYIRNRESALYLGAVGASKTSGLGQAALKAEASRDLQMWRLVPVDVTYETTAPAQPQGLVAEAQQASVKLTWTANSESDLDGYMILRAPVVETEGAQPEWNTIARKVQATTYIDNTCRPGISYIYKVKAIDKSENQSACSEEAQAQPTGEQGLLAHWSMDGTLVDDTPNMMDAAISGTAAYAAAEGESTSQSLNLSTGKQYVQLPYEVASSDELTITMWVKWTKMGSWQRIFDFGNGTDKYIFLTPNTGSVMRLTLKDGGDEQVVNGKQRFPFNTWTHVAVVIGKEKTAIYLNGEESVSSTGITIKPSDIRPVLNYLGRSQFAADPYFQGYLRDVRIYNYALDQEAVAQTLQPMASGIEAPKAEADGGQPTVYGLDGRKYVAPRKGISIVDGKKRVIK